MAGANDAVFIHSKRVLVVERDERIRRSLARVLVQHGFNVQQAEDATTAGVSVNRQRPDLAIIGLHLPDISGLDLLRYLKKDARSWRVPVVMSSECPNDEDKVRGFEAGADDYVATPFSTPELLARIRALLRRAYVNDENGCMGVWGLVIDVVSQRVTFEGKTIPLPPLEFRLLSLLMEHQERTLSRACIFNILWDKSLATGEKLVDAHVKNLRHVLRVHECDQYIQSVRGIGYRFSMKKPV